MNGARGAELARQRTAWMPRELLHHATGVRRRPTTWDSADMPPPGAVIQVANDARLDFTFAPPTPACPTPASSTYPARPASTASPASSAAKSCPVADEERWLAERQLWQAWLERGETLARERRVDGIVYNALDHFPILTEFKTGNDKNPFHALLQLLMYAAELAAPARWHPAFLRSPEDPAATSQAVVRLDTSDAAPLAGPLLDIYIILGDYDERSALHREMLDVTAPFCQRLFQDRSIANYLRRVACLNTRRTERGFLTCHKIFAFPDLDLPPIDRARLN